MSARRFILVAVHRGAAAAELYAERRWNPERFELISACGSPDPRACYVHVERIGGAMLYRGQHYRMTDRGRRKVVLELREVERLWWPEGASIDQRDPRDRARERHRARQTPAQRLAESFPGLAHAKRPTNRKGKR